MAWKLRYFATEQEVVEAGWPVGAIWPDGSGHYFVCFPGPRRAWEHGEHAGEETWSWNSARWEVKGEAPNITVSPSIKFVEEGGYHGYIKDGVILDDCDGRSFPLFPATS